MYAYACPGSVSRSVAAFAAEQCRVFLTADGFAKGMLLVEIRAASNVHRPISPNLQVAKGL
jgi:hypothetical protein